MTAKQKTQAQKALAKALALRPMIRICPGGTYLVRGSRRDLYRVTVGPDGNTACDCQARGACYHRAAVVLLRGVDRRLDAAARIGGSGSEQRQVRRPCRECRPACRVEDRVRVG